MDKNYSLKFNRTIIGPKIGLEEGFIPKVELRSVAASTGFAALNLPGPVLYALKAVSAGFVAAAADGPLPFGDAVLVTASVALAATLAIYWSSVAPKWPQIVRVFERQFSNSISTVRMVLAKVKGDTEFKVKEKDKKESERRVKDVLKGKSKERTTKGKTDIYNGKGGKAQADRDFNKLNKGKVEKKSNGTKVGQLPDGTKINVRSNSTDGRPTLKIQYKRPIKIRYR